MTTQFAPSIRMHHATRAKAARLAEMLAAEYPRLSLVAVEGESVDHDVYEYDLASFDVEVDSDVIFSTEGPKVPDLAEILDACAEEGINPTSDEDEEEDRSGSVVREKYRQTYREVSSNKQTCGDWLAERMVDDTTNAEGKLNVEDLTALFINNGLDMSAKWAMARFNPTRGWQGRYRMSGRIVLEKKIARNRVYIDPMGLEVSPPAEWLAEITLKHAAWLAKEDRKQKV